MLDAVTAYLGLVSLLNDNDVWYTLPWDDPPRASQEWHLDHDAP